MKLHNGVLGLKQCAHYLLENLTSIGPTPLTSTSSSEPTILATFVMTAPSTMDYLKALASWCTNDYQDMVLG